MNIKIYSENIDRKIIYGIILSEDNNTLTIHPGDLQKTIIMYEQLKNNVIEKDELLDLRIA